METPNVQTPLYGINQKVYLLDSRGRIVTSTVVKTEADPKGIHYTCSNGYRYLEDYIYRDKFDAICGFVRHNQGDMSLKVIKVKPSKTKIEHPE